MNQHYLGIDKSTLVNILQSTYELYHIPEKRYEIAKEELIEGINIYERAISKNYLYIDNDLDLDR